MSARDGIGKDAMYHDLQRKGLGGNCAWDVASMTAPDRIALARALVADMPGVVVAKVPGESHHVDYYGQPSSYRTGWNHCISAIITAGSATDV